MTELSYRDRVLMLQTQLADRVSAIFVMVAAFGKNEADTVQEALSKFFSQLEASTLAHIPAPLNPITLDRLRNEVILLTWVKMSDEPAEKIETYKQHPPFDFTEKYLTKLIEPSPDQLEDADNIFQLLQEYMHSYVDIFVPIGKAQLNNTWSPDELPDGITDKAIDDKLFWDQALADQDLGFIVKYVVRISLAMAMANAQPDFVQDHEGHKQFVNWMMDEMVSNDTSKPSV